MLSSEGWDIEKHAGGHGIMLHRSVAHRDGDAADDVARVLWAHVVHVAKLLTAEVALVEALERHVQEIIGLVV